MPFVSPWGGYTIIDDIKMDVIDPKTGLVTEKGNGLTALEATVGRKCDYEPSSDTYKELVWRGVPQPKKINEPGGMYWIDNPVWRVIANRYDAAAWDRFLKHYINHVNASVRPNADRVLWYEPDFGDVEIRDYDAIPLHFPLEIIEKITKEKVLFDGTMTILEESLRNSKVNKPGTVMMTDDQKLRFFKAVKYRQEQEKGTKEMDEKLKKVTA